MSNQQNPTWWENALEIARRYHDTLCDYPKIYSKLTDDEKNIQLQKNKEWQNQIKPLAGEFRRVYLGLKSQLGLPYEADELQWTRVHSDMNGLLLKIEEIMKKIEEHHWEMDRVRKQR